VIAVSSIRNFTDANHEYARNQIAAHQSWARVFAAIVYFNDAAQAELQDEHTAFIPSEPFPQIFKLAEFCMCQPEWCAILNADIIVTHLLPHIEKKLDKHRAKMATSWRHQFDPVIGLEPCERVDNGLDFFAASPDVWAKVYLDCPPELRLGAIQWDSWLLSYFNSKAKRDFYDITHFKCILHPLHGHRAYGPAPPPVHFYGMPGMASLKL